MNTDLLKNSGQYSVFRLPEALTCWQAVAVMGMSYLVAALLFAVGVSLADVSAVFMGLFGLLAFIALLAGTNGAGVCLMDLARGNPFRSLVGYLFLGLLALPKLLGAALLVVLAYLLVLATMALVLLICKIPVLGPVLLVGVVPALVAVQILLLVAVYVAYSLIGPAIWDGKSVLQSLTATWAIARNHPFATLGKVMGGFFLSALFAGVLFGLVGLSSATVGGLTAAVVASGADINPMAMMSGFGGSGSGQVIGAGIGFSLVFVATASFALLLPIMVGVLTWCEFIGKVDTQAVESQAKALMQKAKDNVEKSMQAAQAAAQPVSKGVPALACPQCANPIGADDLFCGSCGHKLK